MGVVHYLRAPGELLLRETYQREIDAFMAQAIAQVRELRPNLAGYGVLEIRTVRPDPERPLLGTLSMHQFSGDGTNRRERMHCYLFTEDMEHSTYRAHEIDAAVRMYERALFPFTDRIPRIFAPQERFVLPVGPAAMQLLRQLNARTSHELRALEEVLGTVHALSSVTAASSP